MAFDEATVAEIVRQRLGITDAAEKARVIWAIPQALDRLARKIAQNPKKRPLLMTSRATAITLTNAAVDLNAYAANAANKKILVEYLDHGTIWYEGSDLPDATIKQRPMQRVRNPAFAGNSQHLSHPFAADYVFYALEGGTLRCIEVEIGNPLGGPISMITPYSPKLTELAGIVELHDEFIDKVVEVYLQPGNDSAEDAEK